MVFRYLLGEIYNNIYEIVIHFTINFFRFLQITMHNFGKYRCAFSVNKRTYNLKRTSFLNKIRILKPPSCQRNKFFSAGL